MPGSGARVWVGGDPRGGASRSSKLPVSASVNFSCAIRPTVAIASARAGWPPAGMVTFWSHASTPTVLASSVISARRSLSARRPASTSADSTHGVRIGVRMSDPAIETLFDEQRRDPPPPECTAQANAKADIYDVPFEEFWEREGRERVTWFEPFTSLLEWEAAHAEWDGGGGGGLR